MPHRSENRENSVLERQRRQNATKMHRNPPKHVFCSKKMTNDATALKFWQNAGNSLLHQIRFENSKFEFEFRILLKFRQNSNFEFKFEFEFRIFTADLM